VRLRAAGKTLMIDVVADSLRMTPVPGESVAMADSEADGDGPGLLSMFFGSDDEPESIDDVEMSTETPMDMGDAEVPWYTSVYHLAAGVGLILALLIMVFLVIKRRHSDVMDGLDDFDDEYEGYLDDEEEEEEDER
ncbi:MAG: hypothetical protein VYB08_04690, partial [Candidatus Latescibacterota bacterium]|nr:hypothetical protein [Candidatus Latescibacterota bacterium]